MRKQRQQQSVCVSWRTIGEAVGGCAGGRGHAGQLGADGCVPAHASDNVGDQGPNVLMWSGDIYFRGENLTAVASVGLPARVSVS